MENNFESEKDYYYSEFKQKFDEYLKSEKEYHDYSTQFFTHITNGKIIKKATKSLTPEEFKKMMNLRKRKEDIRQIFRKAEIKFLSISRQSL